MNTKKPGDEPGNSKCQILGRSNTDENLTTAPLPRKSLHCIYCNCNFERRAGGRCGEMLCEPCENGQRLEVMNLEGGSE